MNIVISVKQALLQGRVVLIYCKDGMNRSAALVCLTLMLLGHTAETAIQKIRDAKYRKFGYNWSTFCDNSGQRFHNILLSKEARTLIANKLQNTASGSHEGSGSGCEGFQPSYCGAPEPESVVMRHTSVAMGHKAAMTQCQPMPDHLKGAEVSTQTTLVRENEVCDARQGTKRADTKDN